MRFIGEVGIGTVIEFLNGVGVSCLIAKQNTLTFPSCLPTLVSFNFGHLNRARLLDVVPSGKIINGRLRRLDSCKHCAKLLIFVAGLWLGG